MKKSKMILRYSLAIIAAIGFSGCANMPMPVTQSQHAQPTGRAMALNGLTLTEVKSFPENAWWGMPQIKSTSDLQNMARVADMTAKISIAAARKGNSDLAVAEWLWYQRFATHTLSIMENSVKAMESMNGGSSGAMMPGNSLVILPIFNRYGATNGATRKAGAEESQFQSKPVMLAGGGLESLSDALNMVLGDPNANRRPLQPVAQYDQGQTGNVSELPLNQPVMLDNGIYVERRADSMVAYNPSGFSVELPLKDLNYLPAIAAPGSVRKAAAPFMHAMRDSVMRIAKQQYTYTTIAPPNLVTVGRERITYTHPLDNLGNLSANKDSSSKGVKAYQTNPAYKMAIDINANLGKIPVIDEFTARCKQKMYGFMYEFKGDYAEIVRFSCTQSWSPMYSKDFYVTGDAAVQTYESLLNDKKIIQDMEKEVAKGEALDDVLSFVPVVGNIENALQCAGLTSGAQYMNLARISGSKQMNMAQLAGWQPSQTETSLVDTAMNCVGAIPVLGNIGRGAKIAASGTSALNKADLAAKAGKYTEMLDIFRNTFNLKESAAKTAALFPGNRDLPTILSRGYDIMDTSANIKQAADGMTQLYAYYSGQ